MLTNTVHYALFANIKAPFITRSVPLKKHRPSFIVIFSKYLLIVIHNETMSMSTLLEYLQCDLGVI